MGRNKCFVYSVVFSPVHKYRVREHESNTTLSVSTQTVLCDSTVSNSCSVPCTTNKIDEATQEDVLRYFLKRHIFPQAQTVFIKSQLSSYATSQVQKHDA